MKSKPLLLRVTKLRKCWYFMTKSPIHCFNSESCLYRSTWCYWAFYALAVHPNIQDKLYNDIMKHASGDTVVLEQAEKMQYLWAFMNEVLRLYSPVAVITRFSSQQETWKGYTIPPDTHIRIPIHLIHRHPDHWTDPDDFLPERWLDEEANNKRHKFAFIPFSAGGRNCIGQRFAEMEAKLIVANIARSFLITLADSMKDKEIFFTNFIALKSNPPIEICVTSRQK